MSQIRRRERKGTHVGPRPLPATDPRLVSSLLDFGGFLLLREYPLPERSIRCRLVRATFDVHERALLDLPDPGVREGRRRSALVAARRRIGNASQKSVDALSVVVDGCRFCSRVVEDLDRPVLRKEPRQHVDQRTTRRKLA